MSFAEVIRDLFEAEEKIDAGDLEGAKKSIQHGIGTLTNEVVNLSTQLNTQAKDITYIINKLKGYKHE